MGQHNKETHKKGQPVSMDDGRHMDILMINALLNSLFTIFATMIRLKIEPGIPVLKQGNTAKGATSAIIGMKAEGVNGSVALSLTLPTIRAISLCLLGEEISNIDKEAVDLTGELTNMLVGGAKRILSEKGHDFDMEIPQLMMGDGHDIVHYFDGQTVLLPVKINEDEFYLEMNFI